MEQSLKDLQTAVDKARDADIETAIKTRPYWEAKRKLEPESGSILGEPGLESRKEELNKRLAGIDLHQEAEPIVVVLLVAAYFVATSTAFFLAPNPVLVFRIIPSKKR